jgi:hypothetical protein
MSTESQKYREQRKMDKLRQNANRRSFDDDPELCISGSGFSTTTKKHVVDRDDNYIQKLFENL